MTTVRVTGTYLSRELRDADRFYQQLLKHSTPASFTGERVVPGSEVRYLLGEHLARYALVRSDLQGQTVLDVASGEGYGSAFLAQGAQQVVGIDRDPDAVGAALKRYGSRNLSFAVHDLAGPEELPWSGGAFQGITAFEILEHLEDPVRCLRKLRRVLEPTGFLWASTPNPETYSPQGAIWNPFHKFEWTQSAFLSLLKEGGFQPLTVWGQRRSQAEARQTQREKHDAWARWLVRLDFLRLRTLVRPERRKEWLKSYGVTAYPLAEKAPPSSFLFLEGGARESDYWIVRCRPEP